MRTEIVWWFKRKVENGVICITRYAPKWLSRWIVVHAANRAAGGNRNPGEVTAIDMLNAIQNIVSDSIQH